MALLPIHDSAIDITGSSGPARLANYTFERGEPDIRLDELSILSTSAPDASPHASLGSLAWLGLNRSFSHGAPARVSIQSLPSEILQDALSHLIPHVPPSKSIATADPAGDGDISGQSPDDPDPATTPNLDPSPNPSASEIRLRNLLNASRVNKAFHETAKRLLWEDVQVTGGRGWMSVVDALVEEVDATDDEMGGPVDWDVVRQAGQLDLVGPPARSPMNITMPRSPFQDMHGTGEHLPLPVGELAFSVASPISPTGSVISRESYMVNSHYSPAQACAEAVLPPVSTSLPATQTSSNDGVEILRSAPPRVVSLLTPAQSRLSSPSPARRRLQSRSRSQSKPRFPTIPAKGELGSALRSRSPSSGASGAGQGSAATSAATATPPRSRLSSLSRAASYRGRPGEADDHAHRGIDAVLAEDERSRSMSSGKLERPAGSQPVTVDSPKRPIEMLYDEDAVADGDDEEDRGRSGWSRTSRSTSQSVAEQLFARPSHSSSSPSRTRATRAWSFATNMETEDVMSLEAKHRLDEWEVSSFQWEGQLGSCHQIDVFCADVAGPNSSGADHHAGTVDPTPVVRQFPDDGYSPNSGGGSQGKICHRWKARGCPQGMAFCSVAWLHFGL